MDSGLGQNRGCYTPIPVADLKAVVYDFRASRAGEHALSLPGSWQGKLVCDDFAGYKAGFEQGVTEIGYVAPVRRKLLDLHAANQSQLAELLPNHWVATGKV